MSNAKGVRISVGIFSQTDMIRDVVESFLIRNPNLLR